MSPSQRNKFLDFSKEAERTVPWIFEIEKQIWLLLLKSIPYEFSPTAPSDLQPLNLWCLWSRPVGVQFRVSLFSPDQRFPVQQLSFTRSPVSHGTAPSVHYKACRGPSCMQAFAPVLFSWRFTSFCWVSLCSCQFKKIFERSHKKHKHKHKT